MICFVEFKSITRRGESEATFPTAADIFTKEAFTGNTRDNQNQKTEHKKDRVKFFSFWFDKKEEGSF